MHIARTGLRITRTTSNQRDTDYFSIIVTDEDSGQKLAVIELTGQELAEALTGLHVTPAAGAEVTDHPELIGTVRDTSVTALGRVSDLDAEIALANATTAVMYEDGVVHSEVTARTSNRGRSLVTTRWRRR